MPPALPGDGYLEEVRLHYVLGYQLAQAFIVTNAIFMELIGEPLALRPVEYTLLALIAENPGGSLARLARAMAVTSPNITIWVDRLEKRALVRRHQSRSDRRLQALEATSKGQALAREATERILCAERQELKCLSPGEWLILVELLHKIACVRAAAEPEAAGNGEASARA